MPIPTNVARVAFTLLGLALFTSPSSAAEPGAPAVGTVRVPGEGLQPQAATDAAGRVHVVYFKGEPGHGDLFYVRSDDACQTFSTPLRVNSQPGSAIATGTVRGAHLSLGRNARVHVGWMGAQGAEPKAPDRSSPMLYARLAADGKAFEAQRNLIHAHPGLDGGGSVAADAEGNVYVAWHAPGDGKGEAARQVWVTRSTDDGDTFEPERAVLQKPTGVCACCGMRVFAPGGGRVLLVYRSASETIHRDVHLLRSDDHGRSFRDATSDEWTVGKCVMSTASAAASARGVVMAWETQEQVRVVRFTPGAADVGEPVSVPGPANGRKHPAVAVGADGRFVIGWTEGTGWNRGGAVAWQAFDAEGKPIDGAAGRADGVPAWSLPAVVATEKGFRVLY
jgi:hypothetical protein